MTSCSRSKEAIFYLLDPLPLLIHKTKPFHYFQIGIDLINIPAFIEKPQLMIRYDDHRVKLEEYHQWAEALSKNITRVIETNLTVLLPGSLVESAPWDVKFHPNYSLQVNILKFDMDLSGRCQLNAQYNIYQDSHLIKRKETNYLTTVSPVTIPALVAAMNKNLTLLTQDIAQSFRSLKYSATH